MNGWMDGWMDRRDRQGVRREIALIRGCTYIGLAARAKGLEGTAIVGTPGSTMAAGLCSTGWG